MEILPNYDQERVYFSDVKKIFHWFNLLHKSGNLMIDEPVIEEPAKKVASKKVEATESTDEAPKKTRAPRKKAEKTVE